MAELDTLAPTIQDLYEQDELARLQDDADAFEEQQDRLRLAERRAQAPAGVGAFALPQPKPQAQPQAEAHAAEPPASVPQARDRTPGFGRGPSAFGPTRTEPVPEATGQDSKPMLRSLPFAERMDRLPQNIDVGVTSAITGGLRFIGLVESNLEQLIGIRTPAGRWSLAQAERLDEELKAFTPEDPDALDKFIQTAAQMLPVLGVGMGVKAATSGLSSWVAQYGPRLAPWIGASTSGLTEAALEAGNAYKTLTDLFPPEEATRRANEIFWTNAALLAITNRLGIFNDRLPLLFKIPAAMVGETGQELMQTFRIERDGLAVPVDHPNAALLRANGWVEVEQPRRTLHTGVFSEQPETERVLKLPITWEDVRDITAISAILGGMGAVVETALTPDELPGGGGGRTPPATPGDAEAFLHPGEFGFVGSEAAHARAEAQAPASAVRDPAGGLQRVFPLGDAGAVGSSQATQPPGETAASEDPDAGHPLPESQVVDGEGNLQRVFHGTSKDFEQFDTAKADPQGLYGPGVYFTEASDVASGYTKRLTPGQEVLATTEKLGDAHRAQEQLKATHPDAILVKVDGGYEIRTNAAQPNVRPAYLDIRNPFDMDRRVSSETYAALGSPPGYGPNSSGQQLYENLVSEVGSKENANARLQELGFDGITHRGGGRVGTKPHRVWIAFTPEQVIPAFDLMQQLRDRQARGQRGSLDLSSNAAPRLPKLPLTVQFQQHEGGVVVRWEHANGRARNRVLPSYQEALQFAADFQADFDVTIADTSPIKPESLPRPRVGFDAFRRTPNAKRGTAPVRPYPTVEELESGQQRLDLLGNERGAVTLFGQEQPDDIPDPAVPPELAAEGGAQPSPEQLGLGGMPQQRRFQLPPDLAKATPRLGSVPLAFANPMDMALYILGNAHNRSAADRRYLQEVMDFTRQHEGDVRKQAAARRQAIVDYARPRGEAGVPLRIPDLSQGQVQTASTLQAQPGEEAQPLLTGLKLDEYRDAQGLPLLSPDTVQSLRDFLRLQETDQEIEGKPRDVNFKMVHTDEGVTKVLAAVSEVYLDEIDAIRQHKTRDEVRQEALAMGMTLAQFLRLDREEIVSRKKAALSQEFLVAGGRQLKVAQALWRNGNLSGRDFLRVFAIQVAIQSQTARLKNESGGALSQLARPVEGELFSLRGFESIMEYLGSQNVSAELLDQLLQAAPTPEQLEMKLEQAPDATGAGMLREWFYGLYLLSFTPHVANIVSNFGLLGDGYLSRVLAARSGGKPLSLEDALLRAQAGKDSGLTAQQKGQLQADAAALFQQDLAHGEANSYLWGVTHAFIDGLKLAGRSAKAGVSMFEEDILKGRTGENIIEATLGRRMGALTSQNLRGNLQGSRVGRVALTLTVGQRGLTPMGSAFDVMGKLFTLSGRGLLAEDAFFKFLHYQGELHAHAWRKAVEHGTAVDPQTGTLRKRADVFAEMQRFVEHPPPEVRKLAMQRANELTLTKDFSELGILGSAVGGGLDKLARGSVVGMLIFPFMRIAANAVDYSLQRLPLASLLQQHVRADLRAGGARAKMRKGQLAMGHMLFGVAALFAGLGLIRGSGPDDPDALRLKRATGWEPYTIVVPGTSVTVDYNRFEPFAQSIAIAADLMDAYPEIVNDPFNYQEWLELAAAGALAFAENIFHKSYAEGMENLTELVFSKKGTPESRKLKWERFLFRLSRGLVPSGIGRVETALDPRLNEVRTHLDAWRSRLPKASDGLSVQRDYWGDAIELSTTGYGIDIFNPYTVAVDKGLAFGPASVDNLRSALAAKDQERLKVWVSQIMLANTIVFRRPSQFLVRNTRDKDPELSDVDDAIRLPPEAHERLQVLFAQDVTDSQGRPLVEGMAARILEDDWLRDLNQAGRERALRQVHEFYLGKAEATLRRETEADPTLPWYGEVMRALQVQRIRRTRTREDQSKELNVLEQLQQQLEISR